MRNAIVFWTQPPAEGMRLEELVRSHGWDLIHVADVRELAALNRQRNVISVLFHPTSLGFSWRQALNAVRKACPRSLPIIGQGFGEKTPWPEMAEVGAFHSFYVPLDLDELRQSFSFVRAATNIPKQAPSLYVRRLTAVA